MTRRKVAPQFFLSVLDDDRKLFRVEGPMTSDSSWNRGVVEAQGKGRNVRCTASHLSVGATREGLVEEWTRRGYTFSDERLVSPVYDW